MRNASSDIQSITEIFRKSLVTDPPRSMVSIHVMVPLPVIKPNSVLGPAMGGNKV